MNRDSAPTQDLIFRLINDDTKILKLVDDVQTFEFA